MKTLARFGLLCLLLSSQSNAQDGTCKVGSTCRAYGLQPPGIASASLPACNTTVKGRIMQCTNCNTGSTPCMTYCNGSAWSCVATAASTSDTCTGTACNIGGGGVRTDGGVVAMGDIEARTGSLYARETSGGAQYIRLVVSGNNHYFDNNAGTMFVCSTVTGVCNWAYSITGTTVSTSSYTEATTYLRTIGVATGSFPTCNAALKGAILTDTTLNELFFCNGSAWEQISP